MDRAWKRLALLCGMAAGLGLAAGGAAWLLLRMIAVLTNVALFGRWGSTLPSFATLPRSPRIVLVAVAGGAVVTLLALWSPVIRGHGIPEAMDAVLTGRSRIRPRAAVAKPLSAAVAIGTGGPFGAEGPIIVTGGALGSLLGQAVHVSASERKILLATGAAAGMAATFGTPLAAVVLVMELLLFEYSARAVLPLVVAASVAGAVHAALFGGGPLFPVPPHAPTALSGLPAIAVLGAGCGLLAVLIARGLSVVEHLYGRLPVAPAWHPVIGALVWSSLGLLVPRALGVGYDVIGDAISGRLALGVLVVLAVAKLVIWWVALGSGTSGGTLAPILIVASCAGAAAGQLAAGIPGADPTVFALVAMAATFGAAARAPLAAIVFVFELTRDAQAVVPLMLAAVVADLIARALLPQSIMTDKLHRRGVVVPSGYHADPLRTTTAAEAAVRIPVAIESTPARRVDAAALHAGCVVVDTAARVLGVVPADRLLHSWPSTPVEALVEPAAVVPATSTLREAAGALHDHGFAVVVDGAEIRGVLRPVDLAEAQARHLDHDDVEPGWLALRRHGTAPDRLRLLARARSAGESGGSIEGSSAKMA